MPPGLLWRDRRIVSTFHPASYPWWELGWLLWLLDVMLVLTGSAPFSASTLSGPRPGGGHARGDRDSTKLPLAPQGPARTLLTSAIRTNPVTPVPRIVRLPPKASRVVTGRLKSKIFLNPNTNSNWQRALRSENSSSIKRRMHSKKKTIYQRAIEPHSLNSNYMQRTWVSWWKSYQQKPIISLNW